MAYPSKQDQIYKILCGEFQEKFYPGAKLPPERDYARQLGVARKTLRFVLDRMEQENRIIRNTHGTFLCDERNSCYGHTEQKEPVTILLPCPDYLDVSGYSSSYAHRQMILGAMRAAIESGTHVVTIPVSETNSPEDINWLQLRHLHRDSMVMFSSSWFRNVFPLLVERKCKVGYMSDNEIPFFSKAPDITSINYQLSNAHTFLYHAVKQLYAEGAEKIVYFGSSEAVISRTGKNSFLKALRELNPECRDFHFHVYDAKIPLLKRLKLIRKLYETIAFDALILELNPYQEHDYEFDLYEATGIPLSTKLMTTVSGILHQTKVAEHAKVCHFPVMRNSYEMAKFLLSGQRGRLVRSVSCLFQNAKEFINETKYN